VTLSSKNVLVVATPLYRLGLWSGRVLTGCSTWLAENIIIYIGKPWLNNIHGTFLYSVVVVYQRIFFLRYLTKSLKPGCIFIFDCGKKQTAWNIQASIIHQKDWNAFFACNFKHNTRTKTCCIACTKASQRIIHDSKSTLS